MASQSQTPPEWRIPVVQEELQVGKRVFETGQGVRIHKRVSEEAFRIDEHLVQQELEIEHVPVDAWVDGPVPQQRHEGATLVIPVLEEVLVVEKRLRLKEEIRITAKATQREVSEPVVLRSEHVSIERFDEAPPQETSRDPPAH